MLQKMYLKVLILYLLSWTDAAKEQPQIMIKPKPANGFGSSVVLPVTGNVHPDGYYYAEMHIGQPPKPYFLDIDTGSVLTWLQCDAPCRKCTPTPHPLYKPHRNLVPCSDPICASLHEPDHHCKTPDEQCDYEVLYADHGSSLGVLVKDSFALKLSNGTNTAPTLAFGCGYDQEFESPNKVPYTDGVLGLGIGKSSILAQLRDKGVMKNIIGHCFSGTGGGFLFFGDALVPASGIAWTPIVSLSHSKFYFLGPADLQFGGQATNIRGIPIIFDSGATFTYLTSQPYNVLVSLIKKSLKGKHLKEVEDGNLPICWKGAKPFKSIREAFSYFKPLALSFGNARNVRFQLQPEAYLVFTVQGNVCLGILNGSEAGLKDNLIGDISLQDKLVIYDNERQQVGWAPANCNRLHKK